MSVVEELKLDTGFSRRPPYQHQSSAPPSPSSPLAQPALLFDCEVSPQETPIATPHMHDRPLNRDDISKHSDLHALSSAPSPDVFLGVRDRDRARLSLPPLGPLSSFRSLRSMESPPHTPKGHPKEAAPFFDSRRAYAVLNPYAKAKPSYTTTLTYLLRVPRRLRPFLLMSFCLFVFGVVYLNHAIYEAHAIDHLAQKQAADLDRRDVPELYTHRAQQAVFAQQAEAVVQNPVPYHAKPQLQFADTTEELAALISYITSTTSNALRGIDPSVPLEPSVVLDFDPSHVNARDDLALLVEHTYSLFPIILFGKMRDPWHREIQKMLAEYHISPAPLVVDVDQRRDHWVFIALLERLLGTAELPQLVVKGQVLGSYHDILSMREAGTLRSTLEEAGDITVMEAKGKIKGIRERERLENERILGPAPIVDEA